MGLSAQRQAFAEQLFLQNFNQTKAAIAAGYSPKTARQIASRLMKDPAIQTYLAERLAELSMSANEVLIRQAEIARGTMQHFTKVENGRLVFDFTNAADRLYLIHKVELTTETRTLPGQGKNPPTVIVEEKVKFEVGDFQRAQETLMKQLGLLVSKTELTGKDGGPIQLARLSDAELERIILEDGDAQGSGG